MRAGQLRHRIMIQKKKTSRNSYGEVSVTWMDNMNCWASIEPIRGKEYFSAQQVQAGVTHRITMRHYTLADGTKINPNCRIKYDDRYFNIQSVINPSERNIMLQLMCIEDIATC